MFRSRYCVLIALLSTAGCAGNVSTTDDPIGEDGKADQVNPTGHDNEGYLVVKTPPSTRGFYSEPYLTYRNTSITPGTKTRFTAGSACLGIYNNLMTDCAVAISQKATTTYELSSLYVHWDPTELAVDFGPQWTVTVTRGSARLLSSIADVSFTQDLLALPGDYHVAVDGVGQFPPTDLSLAAGETKEIDLTGDKRGTIHVIPPASRSFANSPCAGSTRLVQRDDGGATLRAMTIPVQADASYRVFPLTAADASHYEIWTGDNVASPLAVAVGKTVDFKVKRIDVNDVLVTRDDGTTYSQKGTYVVSRQDPTTGVFSPDFGGCSSATPSGLDVSPGVYKISTSWTTSEGPDSEDDVLDLR